MQHTKKDKWQKKKNYPNKSKIVSKSLKSLQKKKMEKGKAERIIQNIDKAHINSMMVC